MNKGQAIKYGLIGVALVIALAVTLLWASEAQAVLAGTGPHNENGNNTLDVCTPDNWDGALGAAINDFNFADRGNAPKARQVELCSNADIKLIKVPYTAQDSPGLFSHGSGVDIASIRNTVDNNGPNMPRLIRHEALGHGAGMSHTGRNVQSVMSGYPYDADHFTTYDRGEIRKLPNKYGG